MKSTYFSAPPALLGLLFLLLTSCSSSAPAGKAPGAAAPLPESLELYMSRATLSGTKFEHFKLLGQKLFVECGDIQGGRQSTGSQEVLKLDPAVSQQIGLSASSVFEVIDKHPFKFETPGSNKNLFDPGQFTLSLETKDKQHKLESSFDSAISGDFQAERRIKKTAELLRGAAQEKLCGNKIFFGLGTRS